MAEMTSLEDNSDATCPQCQAVLPPNGTCRACLLEAALEPGAQLEKEEGLMEALDRPGADLSFHRFGDYELVKEIARGGMGIVLSAYQVSLKRKVAIKFIRGERLNSREVRRRFRFESEAAARLDHPHIVPVYEVGEHDGCPYLSMKLIEGGDLASMLRKQSAPLMEPRETAAFLTKIAHAVHYAHERGILHRDLKPANILLDEQGEPFVTDFGLAKLTDEESDLTRTAALLGTPRYMSPEQCQSNDCPISTASDVFALGIILYEMLAGRPPFEADSTLELMRKVVEEEPPRLNSISSNSRWGSSDLETICFKCLEKEPSKRYASAAALADDLERFQAGEPILARRVGSVERTLKWARRRPLVAALAASTLLAIVIGGVSALVLWREATQMRDKAESNLYAATIVRAAQALEKGNFPHAVTLLEQHPKPGMVDPRGWEWHFLHSVAQPQPLHRWDAKVSGLEPMPDGSSVLTTKGGVVKSWSLTEEPKTLFDLKDANDIRDFEIDPAGKWLAVIHSDGDWLFAKIRVYEYATRQLLAETTVSGWYQAGFRRSFIAFVPDRKMLLIAGNVEADPQTQTKLVEPVRYWEFLSGNDPVEIPRSTGKVSVSPDGELFATTSPLDLDAILDSNTKREETPPSVAVTFWQTENLEPVGTCQVTDKRSLISISFSRSGESLLALSRDQAAVVDVAKCRLNAITEPVANGVYNDACFLDGDRTFVTVGNDWTARLWDTQDANPSSGQIVASACKSQRGHAAGITVVEALSSNQYMTASQDGTMCLWSTDSARNDQLFPKAFSVPLHGFPISPVFSADGRNVAAKDLDMTKGTKVWDLEAEAVISEIPDGGPGWFLPDGKTLVVAHLRNPNRANRRPPWRIPDLLALERRDITRKEARLITRHDFEKPIIGVITVVGSPDGKRFALGHNMSPGGRLTLWDSDSFQLIEELATTPDNPITGVAFSPSGDHVLWTSGRECGLIHLASRQSWKLPGTSRPSFFKPTFSPDGRYFAHGASDTKVRVYAVAAPAKPFLVLGGHQHISVGVSFSPDSKTLAVSQTSGVKLWHLETGLEMLELPGELEEDHHFVHFTRDGRQLLVGGYKVPLSAWQAGELTP